MLARSISVALCSNSMALSATTFSWALATSRLLTTSCHRHAAIAMASGKPRHPDAGGCPRPSNIVKDDIGNWRARSAGELQEKKNGDGARGRNGPWRPSPSEGERVRGEAPKSIPRGESQKKPPQHPREGYVLLTAAGERASGSKESLGPRALP